MSKFYSFFLIFFSFFPPFFLILLLISITSAFYLVQAYAWTIAVAFQLVFSYSIFPPCYCQSDIDKLLSQLVIFESPVYTFL